MGNLIHRVLALLPTHRPQVCVTGQFADAQGRPEIGDGVAETIKPAPRTTEEQAQQPESRTTHIGVESAPGQALKFPEQGAVLHHPVVIEAHRNKEKILGIRPGHVVQQAQLGWLQSPVPA